MKEHRIGIILNGVTGRMGTNQHLVRSICAIRDQGGIACGDDLNNTVDPILTGRSERQAPRAGPGARRREIHHRSGRGAGRRCESGVLRCVGHAASHRVRRAGGRGGEARLLREAERWRRISPTRSRWRRARGGRREERDRRTNCGRRASANFRALKEQGFFGDILSVRGEFGYWFTYHIYDQLAQRPSWNYRAEDGGGIIIDTCTATGAT
ncbi:MAG: hypothetical protein R3F11_32050 [Verrucomicrobiales bacterium]